jgi:omega-6 fatty acid desaturase (delta-12 desaturase)
MAHSLAVPLAETPAGVAKPPSRAELHARLAPFARANSWEGYKSFAIDLAIYVAGIAIVLYSAGWGGKLLGGFIASIGVVNLGTLSHEAAHRALVQSRLGNKILAVVSLTIVMFNYRLWIYDHHVLHHGRTNVKLNNFLSPLTLEEYRARSPFRRALYRAYLSETTLGILLYFMLERWPKVHFYPGAWLPARFRASALGYTALMTAFAAALLALLVLVPSAQGASVVATVVCGFVMPYVVWFTIFSSTAFLQHTNPRLRWYPDVGSLASHPEALSVHVKFPAWLNHATHYVLEHPVHHVSPMIPHYHLRAAQAELAGLASPEVIVMPFTLGNVREVLRRCKLYDYQKHRWLDFEGNVTAIPVDSAQIKSRAARPAPGADLLPDQAQPNSPGIFFPADTAAEPAEDALIAGPKENA